MQHHLILVSAMPTDKAEMCFFTPATNLEEALVLARARQGRNARMLVILDGNLTLAMDR